MGSSNREISNFSVVFENFSMVFEPNSKSHLSAEGCLYYKTEKKHFAEEFACAFLDSLFLGLDLIRPSEADTGRGLLLEIGEEEGFAMGSRAPSGRVDMLLMDSGDLLLTKVLTLKIRGKNYRGMCAIKYKKINSKKDG